jgi:hypothetical protein
MFIMIDDSLYNLFFDLSLCEKNYMHMHAVIQLLCSEPPGVAVQPVLVVFV